LIERIVVFDVFSGPPLADGRKSIGLRLTARDMERTLTDDELAPVRGTVAAAVAASLDGRLRGG
jgi:phenylalanyl-tRNA synthetase beta chain